MPTILPTGDLASTASSGGVLAPIVLVVDDERAVCESLAALLEDDGYTVLYETDARTALARLKSGLRPAVMVVDYLMPWMTGADLLRRCCLDATLNSIPAVMMSALEDAKAVTAELWGEIAFLAKPFDADELLSQLRAVVLAGES
jgi:CheY-like chemotaxis protein